VKDYRWVKNMNDEFKEALMNCYEFYKDTDPSSIPACLETTRAHLRLSLPSHYLVASCCVLYEFSNGNRDRERILSNYLRIRI
jgi:hypothetical protein